MAQAIVKYVTIAGPGGAVDQQCYYEVIFVGSDVSQDIAQGIRLEVNAALTPGKNLSYLNSAIINAVLLKAALLGLTVAVSDIINVSFVAPLAQFQTDSTRVFGWQKEVGSSLNVVNMGTTFGLSQIGTDSFDNDTSGGQYIKYASGSVIGNVSGWASGTAGSYRKDKYRQAFIWKSPADITSSRIWVGCFSASPSASDTPAVHLAGLRYSTGAGDTNFMLCTSDGTTFTSLDSGLVVTALTRYVMVVDMTVSNEVNFYVNQLYEGTLTSNLPGATTLLAPIAVNATLVAAPREFHISHMIGQSL